MMKWIFGLLVLANIVFFAVMQWGSSLTVDVNNPPVQAALNADKIKLLSLPVSSSSVPAAAVEVVAASSVAASAVSAASQVTVASSVEAVSHVAPAAVPHVKLSCMEWGEFSGADLLRVEKMLGAMKLGSRMKQRIVEHGSGYWVFIAPMKGHAQVEQKIAQLKAHNVEDYFVIQEVGAWQNAISLGVFKTEEAAKKYFSQLQAQGIKDAAVGERASKLKFTVFVMNHLEGAVSSKIAGLHKDFPDSELKLVPCN